MSWRVGRSLGRTLYIDDTCVGMMDTPELAAQVVAAMNAGPEMVPDVEGKVAPLMDEVWVKRLRRGDLIARDTRPEDDVYGEIYVKKSRRLGE